MSEVGIPPPHNLDIPPKLLAVPNNKNKMKQGLGPGDMYIDTLIVQGKWVGYLMGSR